MSLLDLLQTLSHCSITLTLADNQLHYRAPAGALTPDLRAQIAAYRSSLIQHLQSLPPPRCTYCDWRTWVDAAPQHGRIRTTCGTCGRFIGYRPASSRAT